LLPKLYEHVISRVHDVPIVAAVVVDPPNVPSVALHRKFGFQPTVTLIPPDGLPRMVWVHREKEPDLLREQLGLAIDLYKHEDLLNWSKLNNLFYVTVGLVAPPDQARFRLDTFLQ
jgi:hypothetical protein